MRLQRPHGVDELGVPLAAACPATTIAASPAATTPRAAAPAATTIAAVAPVSAATLTAAADRLPDLRRLGAGRHKE